eukprot:TRINITY_DN2402_c0_g1_i1.p1 TRINITY_DN2402_c0_g1~~TRINITY_DN2402_c0_g1_i1.p1  ORF type:complete len:549 (-),score=198.23 TRINITY_DN2402_c0_g1_i1:24-1670(-)
MGGRKSNRDENVRNKQKDRNTKQNLRRNREKRSHGDSSWKSDFQKFQEQVSLHGLFIKDVTGDGNCLFRAVSDQIEGHPNSHDDIRQRTVDCIEENREMFEPFIEDDVPFDKYCIDMRKNGEWGGHLELQAMSLICAVNITVHQLDSPRWEINNFGPTARSIHLSYHRGDHYASVRPIGQLTGVPLVNVNRSPALMRPNNVENKANDNNNSSFQSDYSGPASEDEKMIMVSTGRDLGAARSALIECGGDANSAIEYLIALDTAEAFSLEDQEVPPSSGKEELKEEVQKKEERKPVVEKVEEKKEKVEQKKEKQEEKLEKEEKKEEKEQRPEKEDKKVEVNQKKEEIKVEVSKKTYSGTPITRLKILREQLKNAETNEKIMMANLSSQKGADLSAFNNVIEMIKKQKEGYNLEIQELEAVIKEAESESRSPSLPAYSSVESNHVKSEASSSQSSSSESIPSDSAPKEEGKEEEGEDWSEPKKVSNPNRPKSTKQKKEEKRLRKMQKRKEESMHPVTSIPQKAEQKANSDDQRGGDPVEPLVKDLGVLNI